MRKLRLISFFVFLFSISALAQPYLGDLTPGDTFTLSRKTPLLDELNPADPMEAISRAKYLPIGTEIKVISVSFQDTDKNKYGPWYSITVTKPSSLAETKGWINGTALVGQ